MSRTLRWLAMGMATLHLLAVGGCALGRKPFSKDPLFKSNHAVWGNQKRSRAGDEVGPREPTPPSPPPLPLLGDEVVTSRP